MGESLGLPEFTWFMNSEFNQLVDHYLYCSREVRRAVEGYDPWSSERDLYWDVVHFPTDALIPAEHATSNDVAYDAMMRNEILHTVGLAGIEEFSLLGQPGYKENSILRHQIMRDGVCTGVFDCKRLVRNDGAELIVAYERNPIRKDRVGESWHCLRITSPLIGMFVVDALERIAKGRPMEAKLGTERRSILDELNSRGWTGDARFMTAHNLRRELWRLGRPD